MMLRLWDRVRSPFRSVFAFAPKRRKPSLQRYRPLLEEMERRLVPASFTVTTLVDRGEGSLRAAIEAGNDSEDSSVEITFQSDLFQAGQKHTIHLNSALPNLDKNF